MAFLDKIFEAAINAFISQGVGKLFGDGKQNIPQPQKPAVPQGKATAPDLTSFTRPEAGKMPMFLGGSFGSLTPLQQRSSIATRALNTEAGGARDTSVIDYYKNLVFRDMVNEGGMVVPGSEPLPIERQFATQILGQTPQSSTTESFLSSLLRT